MRKPPPATTKEIMVAANDGSSPGSRFHNAERLITHDNGVTITLSNSSIVKADSSTPGR